MQARARAQGTCHPLSDRDIVTIQTLEENCMSARIRSFVFAAAVSSAFAQAQVSSDVFNQLKWRYIGPVGNRVIAAASVPGNPNVYYAGAASGGIFKSSDAGVHWEP